MLEMVHLNIRYSTNIAGSSLTVSISEQACVDLWFEELPFLSYLTTTLEALAKATSTTESVMWLGQFERAVKVFFSGKTAQSRSESAELEWWELLDETEDFQLLDWDLVTLEDAYLSDDTPQKRYLYRRKH
jgi:hypothetical protein